MVLSDLSRCSCVFFPSARETFGNGLYEALALQKKIIVNHKKYSEEIAHYAGVWRIDMSVQNLDNVIQEIKQVLLKDEPIRSYSFGAKDWLKKLAHND